MIVSHGRPFRLTESDSDDVAKEKVKAFLEKNQMVCEEALESAPSYLVSVYAYVLLCFYNVALTFLFPVVVLSLMLKFGFKRSLSGIGDRLGLSKPSVHGKKRSWFHAASLGEWQALKPLMAGFDDASVLITTSSPEARDLIRSEKPGADVFLMPMDVLWIIRPWIKRWTPEALYIVETELWPNMIETCSKRYIPIFVVNGRLSQKSVAGWRRAGALMTRMLRRVSRFYVRTQEDADRFALLGAPRHRIEITGNLKVDQLRTVSTSDKASIRRGLFGDTNGVIVVAGSTWTGEEKMVLDAFKKAAPSSMRLIIAPRRKDRFNEVDALLRKEGVSFDRWSKIKAAGSWTSPILLVDTLGDLKKMYEAADLAFVGGTLVKRGGQNPLEAAACGVPVVFGPSMENFAEEARTLVACGAAVQKETTVDVVEAIVQLLNDPERRHLMGGKAIDAVKRSQGVAEKILSSLKDEMSIHK
jgi:3-deoxy-D-manno-octulosonic-acid transferase